MYRMFGWLLLGLVPLTVVAGEGETRVAVVDVSTVFKNYKKVYDVQLRIDASFEAEKRKLGEEIRKLGEDAREVEQMRRDAAPDSEFVFERVQSLQKQEFALRKRQSVLTGRLDQRYLEEMKDVLGEIRAAIHKAAERGGFEMVLRCPDADDPVTGDDAAKSAAGKDGNPNDAAIQEMLQPKHTLDLVVRFKRNPVLYGSPLVDVTHEVLKDLNDAYAKRAGATPGGK